MTTPVTPDPKEHREAIRAHLRQYATDAKYGDEYTAVNIISNRILTLFTQSQQKLLNDLVELIASLEVKSLPSDDPELRYWQGYHAAQLDITNLLNNKYREGMK